MEVQEGGLDIEVPAVRHGASEGTGDSVFYNPAQELNRDITVAFLRSVQDACDSYLDAMTASGIRAVRAATEGYAVTGCDVDPAAVELARSNLDRNGVSGTIRQERAQVAMYKDRFDIIDIDPFGSPVPFADAAFQGARSYVCVTATDTAPLCGAHFESGVRRYSAVPRNTEFHAEIGLRILLSAMIRTAARYDIAARPVLSHVSAHYVRTYLSLTHGAQAADACIAELGYVDHCQHCLWRQHDAGLIAEPTDTCPHCGAATWTAGPLWLGKAHDPDVVDTVRTELSSTFGTATAADRLLSTIQSELAVPTHYDQHKLYKQWGEPAIAMDEFLDCLRDAGYAATRSHFGGTTFKTDADVGAIRESVDFADSP